MGAAPAVPPRSSSAARTGVVGLGLVLLGAGLLLVVPVVRAPAPADAVPWLVVLAAFVAAEVVVVHTHVGREVHSTSLTDAVLVAGLFLVDPLVLVLARVAGAALAQRFHRRSPWRKVAFNGAVSLVDAGLVVALAVALVPGQAALRADDPVAWLAVYVAVATSTAVQVVSVTLVIGFHEGLPGARALALDCLRGLPVPLVLATLAMVGVAGVGADARFGWLVGAAAVLLLVLQRSYVRLWYRHQSLERMVGFTASVGPGGPEEQTLRTVLERARDLLVAEQAHLHLLRRGPDDAGLTVSVGREGPLRRHEDPVMADGWLRVLVVGRRTSVLVPRDTEDEVRRAWLRAGGVREAAVVPVLVDGEVVAVLWVGDRLSSVRAFDADDLAVLDAVAGQVGLALHNGRLREDVELHERDQEVLRRLSSVDELTGLANRRELHRRLDEALRQDGGTVVLYGDLDGFKLVNDRWGHGVGDEVLVAVAGRLVAAVGPDRLVARVGGDEFVVLCPTGAGVDGLRAELTRAVRRPVVTTVGEVEVGISLGAVRARPGAEALTLLAEADAAMYRAKRGARASS